MFHLTTTVPTLTTQRPIKRQCSFTDDGKKVEQCIKEIERNSIDITVGYQTWFEIGCSLANTFSEGGREYFHRVSQFNINYSFTETDRQYTQCIRHNYGYTISTFFFHCNQFNIQAKKVRKPDQILI
jgi:hypothetical protein